MKKLPRLWGKDEAPTQAQRRLKWATRLGVAFQLGQGNTHTFPMRLSYALIAAHKGGE